LLRKSKVDQVVQGHWLPLRESTFSPRTLDKFANISGDFILRSVNRSGVTTAAFMAGKSTESISA
jgi:hypothetical protein